jgi:ribosomal protein S12 methylthiotransferase
MNALKNEIPEVNRYFGVNNLKEILQELGISLNKDLISERIITGPHHYAYLKISEGCDRSCAFCAIPLIKGKYISRPVEELIDEAQKLAVTGERADPDCTGLKYYDDLMGHRNCRS